MSGAQGVRQAPVDSKRHVLDVAEELFLREGIRASGVDTISAAARVAKTTLYRHYPSKDDLVLAYLRRRDEIHFAWLDEALTRHADGDPAARLDAVIDLIASAVTMSGFTGCPFLNAAAEFPDADHPVRQVVAAHKQKVVDLFTTLAREAGCASPRELASCLALLTDGSYEAGRVLGPAGPVASYGPTAHRLVAEARR
jgi:AcrR family transcriptional regulator